MLAMFTMATTYFDAAKIEEDIPISKKFKRIRSGSVLLTNIVFGSIMAGS